MVKLMEDLDPEVQQDLLAKRRSIPGWDVGCHATTEQWMAFYALLSPPAREFIVDNLLELAQTGSLCVQADHLSSMDASWAQLTEVVKLHNARVDEVTMLRERMAQLEGIIRGDVDLLALARRLEQAEHPSVIVEHPLPADTDYLPLAFDEAAAPRDRALYVVKDAPDVEDGD